MRKRILFQAIPLALSAALLTACGGGDGDGDGGGGDSGTTSNNGNTTAAPATTLTITEENAQPTAQDAFDTNLVTNTLLGIASSGHSGTASITLQDVALEAVRRMISHDKNGAVGRITAQAVSSETESCTYGGTLTYTEVDQDSNPDTSQVGDKVTFTYNACKEWQDLEYNGTQTLTLTRLDEDSETRSKGNIEIVNDLSMKTSEEQASLKGTILLSLEETRTCADCFPTTAWFGLKSDKIDISRGSEHLAIYALDYAIYNDYDNDTWWFTQDNVLDINNGDVIRIDTTARFDGQGCDYPYQGSAMIYGKNSSMKVTARSGNVTDLEIDTNGDGSIDTTKQVGSDEVFSVYCR